jgi:hypothetical protein
VRSSRERFQVKQSALLVRRRSKTMGSLATRCPTVAPTQKTWFTIHSFVTISEHSRRLTLAHRRAAPNGTGTSPAPVRYPRSDLVLLLQIPNRNDAAKNTEHCRVRVGRQFASFVDPKGEPGPVRLAATDMRIENASPRIRYFD